MTRRTPIARHLAAGLIAFAAFGAQAADEPSSTWEQTKTYTVEQKNEAVAEGKKLIAALDRKIDEVGRSVKSANAETKAANRENMAELRAKRKEAAAKLAALGHSSASAWDTTKAGFAAAYKDLSSAVAESYDKLKKKD